MKQPFQTQLRQQQPGDIGSAFRLPRSGDAGCAVTNGVSEGPAALRSAGPGVQPSCQGNSTDSQGWDMHRATAEIGRQKVNQRGNSGDIRGNAPAGMTVPKPYQFVPSSFELVRDKTKPLFFIPKTNSVFSLRGAGHRLRPTAWLCLRVHRAVIVGDTVICRDHLIKAGFSHSEVSTHPVERSLLEDVLQRADHMDIVLR